MAFTPAAKRITSEADLKAFLSSDACANLLAFILSVGEAVKGVPNDADVPVSPPVAALLAALDALWAAVDAHPAVSQSLRYGNPAFREWHEAMVAAAPALLGPVLPPELAGALVELTPYWADSFGNATRIDYGTGHETNFVALLYCLARLGVLKEGDRQALVTRVFSRYLQLMRRLQTTYWLEPAGSHGVWGLDDYQFLPFVWGAAQLTGHPHIRPKSIHSQEVLEGYAEKYLYLGAVAFVKQVKTSSPLWETSPMLNDISAVPNWAKVSSGLLKMYQVEVLGKLPIMQHMLFGSLLPWQG